MTNYEANKETIELITLASGNWGLTPTTMCLCAIAAI